MSQDDTTRPEAPPAEERVDDAVRTMLKEVYERFGIQIFRISADWINVSTLGRERAMLTRVRYDTMTSEKGAPSHG